MVKNNCGTKSVLLYLDSKEKQAKLNLKKFKWKTGLNKMLVPQMTYAIGYINDIIILRHRKSFNDWIWSIDSQK